LPPDCGGHLLDGGALGALQQLDQPLLLGLGLALGWSCSLGLGASLSCCFPLGHGLKLLVCAGESAGVVPFALVPEGIKRKQTHSMALLT
jgi:hypothetical protein